MLPIKLQKADQSLFLKNEASTLLLVSGILLIDNEAFYLIVLSADSTSTMLPVFDILGNLNTRLFLYFVIIVEVINDVGVFLVVQSNMHHF